MESTDELNESHKIEQSDQHKNEVNDDFIETASNDTAIINYVRQYFNKSRTTVRRAKQIIRLVLNNNHNSGKPIDMKLVAGTDSFIRYNLRKHDGNYLKPECAKEIKTEILGKLGSRILSRSDIEKQEDDENRIIETTEDENGKSVRRFTINKNVSYVNLIQHVINNGTDVKFKYDFDNSDLPLLSSPENTPELQRVLIQITSPGIMFDFPINYSYVCPECNKDREDIMPLTQKRTILQVASVNTITCGRMRDEIKANGDVKPIICKERLKPTILEGDAVEAYYYQSAVFKEEHSDDNIVCSLVSFENCPPGQYECVLYKTFQPRNRNQYHLVAVKRNERKKEFVFPDRVYGENYVITLQKAVDKYIEEQTGMTIWGLYPIKCALLLQAAFSYFNWDLIANIFLIGQRSTGKTLVLRYWCPLLYGWYGYSSTGVSISIPALRGTEIKLNLLGREISDLSIGYLGLFRSIIIDEAGQNEDLIKDMKSFIYEMEYSMDKKGGKGIKYVRRAHINLTSNLNIIAKSHYINEVKKLYKDLEEMPNPEDPTTILPKPDWDECWDLFISYGEIATKYKITISDNKSYPNFYLLKAVEKTRTESAEKDKFWIDGMDLAVHDRFPFYFYLVNSDGRRSFKDVIAKNTSRELLKRNIEIVNSFDTQSLINFFKECKKYEISPHDEEAFLEVDKMLDEMGDAGAFNARLEGFYQMVLRASRMMNKRLEYTEEDFNLLKWIIDKTNRKVEISTLGDYNLSPKVDSPTAPVCSVDSTQGPRTLTPGEAFSEFSSNLDELPKGSWRS